MYNQISIIEDNLAISKADFVVVKVATIPLNSLKNHYAINKYLPKDTPRSYGHKFVPSIHRYAVIKDVSHTVYLIYSTRIGTVKDVDIKSPHMSGPIYLIHWQEREEYNQIKGNGRHNLVESYFEENLVPIKNIDKFLDEKQFEEFVNDYFEKYKV